MAVRLESLAKGKGPLTERQLAQAEKWVSDDWESHDIDRDAVRLISRLIATVKSGPQAEGKKEEPRRCAIDAPEAEVVSALSEGCLPSGSNLLYQIGATRQ